MGLEIGRGANKALDFPIGGSMCHFAWLQSVSLLSGLGPGHTGGVKGAD